jgi:hypothetical protein
MDHKSFETNMIDFVNRNAKAEEDIRNEKAREEQESIGQQRRRKATNAVIESFLWAIAIPGVVVAMSLIERAGLMVATTAITASSLFAYLAGVRLNTLSFRIKKYGGR